MLIWVWLAKNNNSLKQFLRTSSFFLARRKKRSKTSLRYRIIFVISRQVSRWWWKKLSRKNVKVNLLKQRKALNIKSRTIPHRLESLIQYLRLNTNISVGLGFMSFRVAHKDSNLGPFLCLSEPSLACLCPRPPTWGSFFIIFSLIAQMPKQIGTEWSWSKLGSNLGVIGPLCQPLDTPPPRPHSWT